MSESKPKLYHVEYYTRPHLKRTNYVVAMSYGDVPDALELHLKKYNGKTLQDVSDITFLQYLDTGIAISRMTLSHLNNKYRSVK